MTERRKFFGVITQVLIFGLLIVVYLGSGAVPVAKAGDGAVMKCAASQDRVWVYESLGSFDVTAKLKCGETVEIVGRVKGFVKIHSAGGVEGYVPDSTFPGLPPLEDDSSRPLGAATGVAAAAARAKARSASAALVPETPAYIASNSASAAANAASITKAAVGGNTPAAVTSASTAAPAPAHVTASKNIAAAPASAASATMASASNTPRSNTSSASMAAAAEPNATAASASAANVHPAMTPVASAHIATTANTAPAMATSNPRAPATEVAPVAPDEIVLSTAPEVRTSVTSAPSSPSSGSTVATASAPPAPNPAKPAAAAAKKAAPAGKTSIAQTAGAHASTVNASVSASSGTAATTAPLNSASKTSVAVASSTKSSSSKSSASQPPVAGSGNSHVSAAPAPSPAPSVPSNTRTTESTLNLQPSRNVASVYPVAAVVESEDFPDSQPVSESADPACQIFFSAYGLTPGQAKWIAQNRKKRYSSVCPAPSPSQVDFVVLFTHDVDFYGSTMPSPVHTDRNGFSDFSPMTMFDTAVIPLSEADKARHEYVWVFQMKRGAFDPSKFSPRRRYQFTKSEANSLTGSHASARTVEDAFHFMEEQGPAR